MISLLKALFSRKKSALPPAASGLQGAPTRERWKRYPAEDGFVYEYIYRGFRSAAEPPARDFVFEIKQRSGKRHTTVRVANEAIQDVQRGIDRELMDQETYAVAKLTLFRAFDEDGGRFGAILIPAADDIIELLVSLGRA